MKNLALPAAPTAPPLTPRQRQVMQGRALGSSYKEIAGQLNLSEHTVAKHVKNSLVKLGVGNCLQAVRLLQF